MALHEGTKTTQWLHCEKAINNDTENKRRHIILSLKNAFFLSPHKSQKGKIESQIKIINRRTTRLHILSKAPENEVSRSDR
jgi:hypothetical protein